MMKVTGRLGRAFTPRIFVLRAFVRCVMLVVLPAGLVGAAHAQNISLSPEQQRALQQQIQNAQQSGVAAGAAIPSQSGTDNSNDGAPSEAFQPTRIDDAGSARLKAAIAGETTPLSQAAERIAPAAPGEFEIFVERFIGRSLKRYGTNLLLPSNRDFARPADATIPPDYRLNVGDTVAISLTGSAEGSVEKTIDTNGNIFLPSVGTVHLAGVRQGDLKKVLSRAIGTQFRNFRVGVRTTELRGLRVLVTGYAQNPGSFSVNSLSTTFNAILQAGGPAAGGSFRSAKLVRDGREIADIDLYDILIKGNRLRDLTLENEDVIVIPPALPQVAIWGSVNKEAIYEMRGSESLADLLQFAGGITELGDRSRVVVYSADAGMTPGPRIVAADSFAITKLRPGDIVQVLPLGSLIQPIDKQAILVRLEGEVNKPGNYYVAPNTPLDEVVTLAGGLTPRAFVFGTRFNRQSIVAQQKRSFKDALDLFQLTLATSPINADSTIDGARQAAQLTAAKEILAEMRKAEPDGRLVLDVAPSAQSLPGDLLLENGDTLYLPPLPTSVGVFGAVFRPASFHIDGRGALRIKDYIEMAGGSIRGADDRKIFVVRANGSVLTRKNGGLAKAALPGDVVFVPIKTKQTDLLAKIAQISAILFQFGLSAATVAAIK